VFTDSQAVPRRLEVIVRLMNEFVGQEGIGIEDLRELLRPSTVREAGDDADRDSLHSAVIASLQAALQLELIVQERGRYLLTAHGHYPTRKRQGDSQARQLVRAALDRMVLISASEVEPYFTPYYAWYLAQSCAPASARSKEELANDFRELAQERLRLRNPFNSTKLQGLLRWYPFAGLGWSDLDTTLVCNPRDRIARSLPRMLEQGAELSGAAFIQRLGETCPELDGGEVFREMNGEAAGGDQRLTTGTAQALVDLHLDGILSITAQPDVVGWSLNNAVPPNDGLSLRSDRVVSVQWLKTVGH
jgi:hypothetical protein